MSTWVYPFHKISNEIYRPWIPIQVISQKTGAMISVLALLDTGADHSVFPKMAADQTKLDLKADAVATDKMTGLAGTMIDLWKHEFKIHLMSPDWKNAVWKSKQIEIGCVDHDVIPPILGFSNFMCDFKITFNHATKKVIISDTPKI